VKKVPEFFVIFVFEGFCFIHWNSFLEREDIHIQRQNDTFYLLGEVYEQDMSCLCVQDYEVRRCSVKSLCSRKK
jgi:hypothetical protein